MPIFRKPHAVRQEYALRNDHRPATTAGAKYREAREVRRRHVDLAEVGTRLAGNRPRVVRAGPTPQCGSSRQQGPSGGPAAAQRRPSGARAGPERNRIATVRKADRRVACAGYLGSYVSMCARPKRAPRRARRAQRMNLQARCLGWQKPPRGQDAGKGQIQKVTSQAQQCTATRAAWASEASPQIECRGAGSLSALRCLDHPNFAPFLPISLDALASLSTQILRRPPPPQRRRERCK